MKTFLVIASNSDGHEPIGEYTESEIPGAIAADYSARATDEFCPEEYILWQRGPDGRYTVAKFIPAGLDAAPAPAAEESPPPCTRYFRDDWCFWKFPPGGQPMVRGKFDVEWQESTFTSLEDFLDSTTDDARRFRKIPAEEGEP